MELLWIALIAGAVSFPHCLGMCGGFALHLAAGARKGGVLSRQLLWHLGRVTTYVFLGALAGFFGRMVSLARWPVVRDIPGYLAGAVMIVMGIAMLGLGPPRRARANDPPEEGLFTALFRQFFQHPSPLSALTLGLATGFLPCPITIGILGLAAAAASVPLGMGIMAAMGVGTIWALLALGLTGRALATRWGKWGAVVVGIALVLMGAWTVLRKAHVLPPLPGLHLPSAVVSTAGPPVACGCH